MYKKREREAKQTVTNNIAPHPLKKSNCMVVFPGAVSQPLTGGRGYD